MNAEQQQHRHDWIPLRPLHDGDWWATVNVQDLPAKEKWLYGCNVCHTQILVPRSEHLKYMNAL